MTEPRRGEISPVQLGSAEIGTYQAGGAQAGFGEPGADEHSLKQIHFGQVRGWQRSAIQL